MKKFKHYNKPSETLSFWSWVYFSWNYIGGTPPKRHIGVRYFGFVFEETEEIPMGELRF